MEKVGPRKNVMWWIGVPGVLAIGVATASAIAMNQQGYSQGIPQISMPTQNPQKGTSQNAEMSSSDTRLLLRQLQYTNMDIRDIGNRIGNVQDDLSDLKQRLDTLYASSEKYGHRIDAVTAVLDNLISSGGLRITASKPSREAGDYPAMQMPVNSSPSGIVKVSYSTSNSADTRSSHKAAPLTEPQPTTYKVKYGDWLSHIASRHGVKLAELMRWNQICDPDHISTGKVLMLREPKNYAPYSCDDLSSRSSRAAKETQTTQKGTNPHNELQPTDSGANYAMADLNQWHITAITEGAAVLRHGSQDYMVNVGTYVPALNYRVGEINTTNGSVVVGPFTIR